MLNPHYVIFEVAPDHWAINCVGSGHAGAGRSTYPTAQVAQEEALRRNANATTEVYIRASDQRIPDLVRGTLVALAATGFCQAGTEYHLTHRQLGAMGLTHDDITRLSGVRIPYLGATPAQMTGQNVPAPGDAKYTLRVTLRAD
ncbi:hypothetical protein [Trinickia diaoshuihuensis]|uniref:hypothetical protein n=1 Tax=Trinickia diaoshuihuensis TaxID=2292265 RepID=UPI000E21E535|nr:hypothetical protein [Trinickia diaoshuihuensis]